MGCAAAAQRRLPASLLRRQAGTPRRLSGCAHALAYRPAERMLEARRMLREADTNGDGRIRWDGRISRGPGSRLGLAGQRRRIAVLPACLQGGDFAMCRAPRPGQPMNSPVQPTDSAPFQSPTHPHSHPTHPPPPNPNPPTPPHHHHPRLRPQPRRVHGAADGHLPARHPQPIRPPHQAGLPAGRGAGGGEGLGPGPGWAWLLSAAGSPSLPVCLRGTQRC